MTGREGEAEAAAVLRECHRRFAAEGSSPVAMATGGGAAFAWRHYPEGEVYDPSTHAQYFYHRHGRAARPHPAEAAEHGHFHLFLRGEGIPAGIAPLLLPELAVANVRAERHSAPAKRGSRDEVCHLVAIAMDARGEPTRLFTTNRWVTGETWYCGEDVVALLDRFRVQTDGASALLDRWLGALVRLYRAKIGDLLRERDQAVVKWRWRWPRRNAFEDTRLEITSSVAIDLAARLAAAEAPVAAARLRTTRPPRLAEGWGA